MNNIDRILHEHDPSVIACIGLIPNPLGRLFIQLISSIKQNEIYQCRAIHLLFLLCPIRLVQQIIKPLFELMATVANQPDCEVDKTSLVVLFSPIFFLDRSTTIPISLANPLPIHVLNLCVKLARDELKTNLSVTKLFQVPSLFLHDCTRTLILHQIKKNPKACFFSHYLVYNTTSNNHSNTDKNNHNSEITHQRNLLLTSLNGLIWYQGNILAGTNDPDPLGQLNCLQQTFEWARKRKDKLEADHLNRNNDGLQHDDMDDRNHLINDNNNIISFKDFPSTTKHVSIVNIPKCDYVQTSSSLLFSVYCICLYV
ncbi:unnamed protein product [Schistosoma haematobium]|nr:unnamed protein product [Schistosoma haematobium]